MNMMDAAKEWATRPADQRFQSLDDMIDVLRERRYGSTQRDAEKHSLRVLATDHGGLLIGRDGEQPEAAFTHWGFGQVCRLAGAPAYYLRTLPASVTAQCLNYGLRNYHNGSESQIRLLLRSGSDGMGRLAAATSTGYGRVWDVDVAEAVRRTVNEWATDSHRFYNPPDLNGTPAGLYASDHDVFIFMIDGNNPIDAGGNDQLHRGFIVWNSETGARTFGLTTFLFRVVCGNHIIWDAEDVNRLIFRHTSGAPDRFDKRVYSALVSYVKASTYPVVEKIQKAKALSLEDVFSMPGEEWLTDRWIAGFADRFRFGRKQVADAIENAVVEEGKCESAWDMAQGLTRVARDSKYMDERFELEKRTGQFLATVTA